MRSILATVLAIGICGPGMAAAELDFATQIRPILSDKCFACHGPDKQNQKAGLRLDIRDEAVRERDGIIPIAPGKPEESEIVRRMFATDSDDLMPPPETKNPLSAAERELLKEWIAAGAPYQGHWAFEKISKPAEPEGMDRARTAIDRFVGRKLKANGFGFAPDVRREKLIRRVAFDLTGLPPTRLEIASFLNDRSPTAFEKVVDGYLSRTAYGERMASEWMDVARYSDTYGYQVDRDRYVWPYRDWVIRAFNGNMPYDQFVTEQVAGDLIPNATDQQILATTFNRLHPQKVEGGSVPEEFRIEYVSDRTQTFATAFLGLTMECCKCHDHKYDPVSQEEYYQLSSFFDNIDEAGLYSFFTPSVPTPTLVMIDEAKKTAITQAEKTIAEKEQMLSAALNSARAMPRPEQLAIPGLVGFYDFEPTQGVENTVNPVHGGAGVGRNEIVAGRIGKGVKLTGDDTIRLGLGNFSRSDPFTISLWLQSPTKFDRAVVFHRSRAWTDAASRGYELLIEDGRLSAALIHFYPGNALRVRAKGLLPLNRWVHVTMAYDGSSRAGGLHLFVDGEPVALEVVRDKLTKNITGGGGDTITIGARFRDRGFKGGRVDEFKIFDRRLTSVEIRDVFSPGHLATRSVEQLQDFLVATEKGEVARAAGELKSARMARSKLVDGLPEIMVMQELQQERPTFLLDRGAYDQRRQQVSSATPASLHPYPKGMPRDRLGLAKWLTDPANPLTARVTVNRYWQMLFGRGLVKTANDLGSQGSPPTHPELLNWLAADFIEHGWNVKRLLKLMVTSTVYRQDTVGSKEQVAGDPENLLLGRAPRYRLAAEMIRDNALFLSGLLVPKVGGASVKPYEVAESFKPAKPDKGDGLYRRSLYTYWKRTAPAPVMMALDAARRDVCTVSRETTATPLQAFVFMNDPQFVEAARKVAERALVESKNDPHKAAHWIFHGMTSRKPAAAEAKILEQLYDEQLAIFAKAPTQAVKFLKTGNAKAGEVEAAKLAALNVVASALMSHDESVMKR
jgi:hypothetical protein